MAILFQVICLTFLLGLTYGRDFSYFIDESFPSTYLDEPFDDDWPSSAIFDDFENMMEKTNQESQQMSAWASSIFKTHNDDMTKIKNKLADVTPVCITTPNSTAAATIFMANSSTTTTITTTLMQNNKRKQFRSIQTTTCIKALISNGTKYMYREIKITDDKGITISQNSDYQSFTINTNNNTTSSSINT